MLSPNQVTVVASHQTHRHPAYTTYKGAIDGRQLDVYDR
jgi:hypothetical protein